jgi:GTPase-activator protein for Ras-like GTPase
VFNRSNLPRNVTVAEALEHEEVQARLRKGISALQETVALFLERICAAREQLPYSLLCTARTLHNALASRFPTFPEKDLLKVEMRYIVFFVYKLYICIFAGHWQCDLLPLHKCSHCGTRCVRHHHSSGR